MTNQWQNWDGQNITKRLTTAGNLALLDAAELLLDLSQDVVPVDEEPLFKSGAVDSDGPEAVVSYDTPYAVKQHEDLTLNHPKADMGQGGKYLEGPLNDNSRRLLEAVRDTLISQTGLDWKLTT